MRFKTDRRLWFAVSPVLFIAFWFIPIIGVQPSMPGFVLLLGLFDSSHFEVLPMFGVLFLSFAVGAVIAGWILHGIVVIVRNARSQP